MYSKEQKAVLFDLYSSLLQGSRSGKKHTTVLNEAKEALAAWEADVEVNPTKPVAAKSAK